MTKKKTILFIAVALTLAAVILACLLPRTTKTDYAINAFCFTAEGEPAGDFQITAQVTKKEMLFREPQLEFSIQPFDRLTWLKVVEAEGENPVNKLDEIQYLFFSAGDNVLADTAAMLTVAFDADMDRWIFVNHSRKVYYVGSVSGDYSAEELTEYFISLVPSNW